MVRWSAFITRFMWRYASRRDGRQARPRRSSTARVPRARKRGAVLDPQGFDAGKKISGRKRHILVDTLGLLLSVAVHAANIQDRDGMMLVLDRRTRRLFPFIERIYGDGGYQGPKAARAAAKTGCWTIEIVGRRPTAVGFEVLPKRWIVERTFAWLSRFRRLARDFERYARTVAAFIRLAMIRIMLKRLVANPSS
jgi:transposase